MKKLTIIAVFACLVGALLITSTRTTAQSKDAMQEKIDRLEAELRRAKLDIAKLTPDAIRGREMPVKIGKRKAALGPGEVLQIQNLSTKTLPVKVTLISPTFKKTNDFDLVLEGATIMGGMKEIGHSQGWAAAAGDLIEIESEGYTIVRKHF